MKLKFHFGFPKLLHEFIQTWTYYRKLENKSQSLCSSISLSFVLFYTLLCAGHAFMQRRMCRGNRTSRRDSVLPCGSQNQYQVIGLNGKNLYPLSHLKGPSFPFYNLFLVFLNHPPWPQLPL